MRKLTGTLMATLLLCSGCATAASRQSVIYPMSYDQTYEMVITAMDDMPGWRLSRTDQLKGLIAIQTGGYFAPRREVKLFVKHLEPFRTEVEIYRRKAVSSDQKFFDAIDRHVQERAAAYPR